MTKLRYGIVGANADRMAGEHIRRLNQLEEVELAALCNVNREHLEEAAKLARGDPKVFLNYEHMLEEDLDVILIAVPNYLHKDRALKAWEAGKLVFCEKPMATTLPDCDAMIQAAEEHGKLLQIGLQRR